MGLTAMMLKGMAKSGAKVSDNLFELTKNPFENQKNILFSLLEKNKDTEIGKKYGFANIKTIEEFQDKIPLSSFDDYSEMIERMTKGSENVITSEKIVHYNVTSGTLGTPKRIPVTEDHVRVFSDYYAKYLNHLVAKEAGLDWVNGKGLSLTEGTYTILPSGASCGSASSLTAARMGKMIPFLDIDMMGAMYTSPKEARQPKPGTPTKFLHILFAIREKNVTYANSTFSSYLLEMMRYLEDNWEMLVETIRTGEFPENIIPDKSVAATLKKKLNPSDKRADELTAIFSKGFHEPVMKKIWPNLKVIITVGGAGFKIYTDKLRKRYCGDDILFLFLGLSASEGMFSVPFECENTNSVFVPDSMFMEFIPVDESGETLYNERPLTLDKLKEGNKYEIVATTFGGLVRYKMKDTVLVTGHYNNTPTMEFINRSGFAISMYGEKTSEAALQFMARKTCEDLDLDMYDYAVCPDDDETPGQYVLCLELRNYDETKISRETIRETAQKYLSEANPSIGKKMDTGVVKPLGLKLLQDETFLLYRDLMVMKGRCPAQLKPVHVLDNPFLKKFFYKLVE